MIYLMGFIGFTCLYIAIRLDRLAIQVFAIHEHFHDPQVQKVVKLAEGYFNPNNKNKDEV